MKKFGVFLGYTPEVVNLQSEGLGRLLTFVVQGILEDKTKNITIACPIWLKSTVIDLVKRHNINISRIEFITTSTSFYFSIRGLVVLFAMVMFSNKSLSWNFPKFVSCDIYKEGFKKHATTLFNSDKKLRKLSRVFLIFYNAIMFIFLKIFNLSIQLILKGFKKIFSKKNKFGHFFSSNININNIDAIKIYYNFVSKELSRLIKKINSNKNINAWFIPTAFWPDSAKIKAHKVLVLPDILQYNYPTAFLNEVEQLKISYLIEACNGADKIVTYSKYVRDHHAVGLALQKNIHVIKHGRVDLSKTLFPNKQNISFDDMRTLSFNLLSYHKWQLFAGNIAWDNFDFANISFLFYSSQNRPQKNILSLVKAVDCINNLDNVDIRLILTCDFIQSPIEDYINARPYLSSKIISVRNISPEMLAAFNNLAILSVNPSLFEGGFPFTFCEAYSVGTPSIMSDIPVVREVLDDLNPEIAKKMLFNPYSIDSIRKKILWAIENREELFNIQKKLYYSFASWQQVAKQYIDVMMTGNAHKRHS